MNRMNTKRKNIYLVISCLLIVFISCTTQEKLAYLNNLLTTGTVESFKMEIPDYKIQYRDILSITIKAMMPTGDFSHITNVITTKIIPYRSGPRKISFGSPVLLIAITVSRFLITPNPMSRKLAVIRPGMMKARYFDQGCSGKSNQHNTKIGPVPM